MTSQVKHTGPLELYDMAREMGLDMAPEELEAALGEHNHAAAVARCESCGNPGECQFFLQRETSADVNKQWWAKSMCPSAQMLLRLAQDRKQA